MQLFVQTTSRFDEILPNQNCKCTVKPALTYFFSFLGATWGQQKQAAHSSKLTFESDDRYIMCQYKNLCS